MIFLASDQSLQKYGPIGPKKVTRYFFKLKSFPGWFKPALKKPVLIHFSITSPTEARADWRAAEAERAEAQMQCSTAQAECARIQDQIAATRLQVRLSQSSQKSQSTRKDS